MRALHPTTRKLFAPLSLSKFDRLHLSLDRDGDKFIAEIYAESPWNNRGQQKRVQAGYAARNDFPKRIPERKQLTTLAPHRWELAATDITAAVIQSCWPHHQLTVEPRAEILFQYLLATGIQQDRNVDVLARWHGSHEVPQHTFELHPELTLVPYQQVALYNTFFSEAFALFMDAGTGKTPVGIAEVCNVAPEHYAETGRMLYVFICCPKSVRMNWEKEFEKFATRCGKVTVMRGTDVQRMKLLADATRPQPGCLYTVVVSSYETMVNDFYALSKLPWDYAYLDESHYIKGLTAKRAKYALQLRDLCRRRRILTGTPIANTLLDLYMQLEFLGKGFSGFSTWKAFRNFYAVYETATDDDDNTFKRFIGVQNVPFMQERLARLSFIISKEEAMPELPPLTYDLLEVEMTKEQRDLYKKVAQELAVESEEILADNTLPRQMVVQNVLTKMLRLAHVTSGFITWDAIYSDDGELLEASAIHRITPNPKLDMLLDVLKHKQPEQKTLVWACWRPDIELISNSLHSHGIDAVTFYGQTSEAKREEAERRFNEDDACKVFVGNPAAGGIGLNLLGYPPGFPARSECNADHQIHVSQDWSSLKRGQGEARNHRRGTRVPIRCTDLVVPNTVDEVIRTRVMGKRIAALNVTDIREMLNTVLQGAKNV